jgi:2,6-dihydroxypyridine 3-monooxygenase
VGYVAWRGIAGEADLSPEIYALMRQAITYYVMPNSHILTYPIPMVDRSLGPEEPFVNWLWYRNVAEGPEFNRLITDRQGAVREVSLPPGFVGERQVEELHEAAASALPSSLVEVMLSTDTPYIQAIFDAEVPRMAFGRVCLI